MSEMSKEIYKLVEHLGGGVSFVEMRNRIKGFGGEFAYGFFDMNVMFWSGMSKEFVEAIDELVLARKIVPTPTTVLVYLMDGAFPKLPIAKQLNRKYKSERWLPIVFNLKKGKEK